MGLIFLVLHIMDHNAELHIKELIIEREKTLLAKIEAQDRHITQAISSLEKAIATASREAEIAKSKAEAASDRRFEAGNEFRASLEDYIKTLMPRTEIESRFSSVAEKVTVINEKMIKLEGKAAGASGFWYLVFGLGSLIVAILALALKMWGNN